MSGARNLARQERSRAAPFWSGTDSNIEKSSKSLEIRDIGDLASFAGTAMGNTQADPRVYIMRFWHCNHTANLSRTIEKPQPARSMIFPFGKITR
jgi:hypothetical protein